MTLTIDTASADITLYENYAITLDGHYFTYHMLPYHEEDTHCGVTVECIYCNEEYHLGGIMNKAQAWTALYYLLGKVDTTCAGDINEVTDTIANDIMPQYVGEPADDSTFNAIENHIKREVGGSIEVEFQ